MNDVVPFGKYKDRPIELLMADRTYVQWLLAQNWFRSNPFYQVVINYGGTPQDTPEHNEMQALFLDDALCVRMMRHLYPKLEGVEGRICDKRFEVGVPPVDVRFECIFDGKLRDVCVELKPTVGDDYPTILRQMSNIRGPYDKLVLVMKSYNGTGATLEQMKAMFWASGILVVFLEDIT